MILDLLDNKHRGYGTMGKSAKFMSIIILPMSVSDFFISHLLIEGKKMFLEQKFQYDVIHNFSPSS